MSAPRNYSERLPAIGSLVAYDFQPHRVLSHDPVHNANWTEQERDAWMQAGMPDPWPLAPVRVAVENLTTGKRYGFRIPPVHFLPYGWLPALPEHYAVCWQCGDLAPCREVEAQGEAEREMVVFDKLANVMPGCCWSCSEPITSRQHATTFAGPNLLLPTAPADPSFHLRRDCRSGAAKYEEMWVAADPTRSRSLLTLTCTGTVVVHHDGSAECFGAVESDCPSVYAGHRSHTACYSWNLDCPRGCPKAGHPGCAMTRLPVEQIRPTNGELS